MARREGHEGFYEMILGISMLLPYLSIASSVVAAGLGIRAASIKITNSIDDMMPDIARQGKWASLASLAAGISVVFQALDRLLQ